MKWAAVIAGVMGLAVTGVSTEAQTGGGYDLTHHVIAGGGVMFVTGGTYVLGNTAGQFNASTVSADPYEIDGGFWTAGSGAPGPTPTPPAPGSPTVTVVRTPSKTPTRTRTPGGTPITNCIGDCTDSRVVSTADLVIGVDIALDILDLGVCPAYDGNNDNRVDVGELVEAVNNSLHGCPPAP